MRPNRVTHQIRLAPFDLAETRQFLNNRGVQLNAQQTIELYMALGGVPLYLEQAAGGKSAAQIIDRACFAKNGILRNEFDTDTSAGDVLLKQDGAAFGQVLRCGVSDVTRSLKDLAELFAVVRVVVDGMTRFDDDRSFDGCKEAIDIVCCRCDQ